MNVLDQIVGSITIQTAWGPDLVIDAPFSDTPGAASGMLAVLKPQITVGYRTGGSQTFAPYGAPGPTRWPWVEAGVLAVFILGGAVAARHLLS